MAADPDVRGANIAVLDSGIGGTGVLAEIRELAPTADLVYVADHGFGAYGERTLDEVRARTESLARYLIDRGVRVVVIACNSASAAALHHLRERLPDTSFVGMEPALKPAAERTRTGVVAILATGATFQGELFKSLVDVHGEGLNVIEQACPGLAWAIETGGDTSSLLDRYLAPVIERGADVVVLGCTHYPLVRDDIERRLPAGTEIIDPAPAVARQTLRVAEEAGIDLAGGGSTTYLTTGSDHDGRFPWETAAI